MSAEESWIGYSRYQSPADELGVTDQLYKNRKKTDLYTGTKSYLENRNKLMDGFSAQINKAYKSVMDGELKAQGVPTAERDRIAMKVARNTKDMLFQTLEDIYSMAEKAYGNMEAISTSNNVAEGNVVSKTPKSTSKSTGKKRGRPAGAKNKKKKSEK
eukprot:gene12727-6920_t